MCSSCVGSRARQVALWAASKARCVAAGPVMRDAVLPFSALQVVKVHDFKTNCLRAVKVIRNKKRFHAQVRGKGNASGTVYCSREGES